MKRNAADQMLLPDSYEEIIEVDPDWSSMGKFNHYADAAVYDWTLDGGNESLGDAESFGHYDLVEVPGGALVREPDGSEWTFASAIVGENSQGFVNVNYFDTIEEGREVWTALEQEYEDYLGEVDDPEYF